MEIQLMNRRNASPFTGFGKIFEDFDGIFENLLGSQSRPGGFEWIAQGEDGYALELVAPGMKPSEIVLRREGHRLRADWVDRRGAAREERIILPREADVEEISAEMSDGILRIRIPRRSKAEVKPVLIPIKSV